MAIEFLIAPIILISLVLYVAWPIMQEEMETEAEERERSELEVAIEEKDALVANLKDIEMDYRMSKLSDEDYERLRSEFEARAVAAIEKVEKLEKKSAKAPRKKR